MTSHQLVQLGTLSTFQDRTRISFAGPTIHHPRILSLISGTLQGTASRRNKSQQASYLHTDTGTFEVAMRRSRKQKSWKRTAIKTATDSFRRIFIWLSLRFAPRSVLFSNIQWLF